MEDETLDPIASSGDLRLNRWATWGMSGSRKSKKVDLDGICTFRSSLVYGDLVFLQF